MRIIISGGGNGRQTRNIDNFFVSLLPKKSKILYIPVAMSERSHTFGNCLDWVRNVFKKHGFESIDIWTDLENREKFNLNNYSAIYIGGGNTFNLLHVLRSSKFDKLLLKYIKKNGLVYGGSAGAIIMGSDIRTASFGDCSDKNLVNLKKFKGFELIKNYSIQCHYRKIDDKKMFSYVKKTGKKTIALPENTGLYVTKNRIKVIGSGNAYVFSEKEKTVFKNGYFI